jgi:DNA-binding response OmpR family regulator
MSEKEMTKILVVEDDVATAEVLREVMQSKGFKAEIAPDAYVAADKLKAGKYDLVMLDIMLPGKTGVQLLEEMIKDKNLKAIPVVVLTAVDAVIGLDQKIKKVRKDVDVLHKPASNESMLKAISKALKK